ncbi:MAG: NADH dehydrogenase (quinone) subunit D [Bacteroidia bacterium]|nr:NADH dehydrogenase (quinone) subunit D [Bacteroidia bacterium]MDW8417208.1 NADH dehydrogenase (quinone) subunit D [Bacteroidia bacterium]
MGNASLSQQVQPTFFPKHQLALYKRLEDKHTLVEIDDSDPLTSKVILNMGPQHPATHGVLRAVLMLDGERIIKAVIDIGYLHRGIEKIAEYKTPQEFMPYTDRMDYLSPYSNNVAFCLAIEKLLGVQAPPRAQYIRTIACELARISSHLLWLGTMIMDAGAVSMFLWTFREREKIYSIFDKLAGVRFTVSHCRIGGVQYDITDETIDLIRRFIKDFYPELRSWRKLLDKNPIFLRRVEGIGAISKEDAIAYGFTGPNLRACGVPYDIRYFEPYLVYEEIDFEIPIRSEGDMLARYHVRMDEMEQSARIVEQCLAKLPNGEIRLDNAKVAYPSKNEVYFSMEGMIHDFMMTDVGPLAPPDTEVYHAIEAPKGELGFYIYSDGTGIPWRVKIKSPSFANIQVLEKLLEGAMVSDAVLLIGSVDPVLGEADK